MGRVRTPVVGLIVLALGGCQKDGTASVPPGAAVSATPAPAAHADVEAFVSGRGAGAQEEQAYVQATNQLAEALLGDARWLAVMPMQLHDRATDPYDAVETADGWEVAVGLHEGRAAATLDAFTYTQPTFEAPEVWQDILYQAFSSHAAKVTCEQRAALFAVACEASPTDEQDAALRSLAAGLSIGTVLRGGVPVDADGMVLRPVALLVTWNGAPVSGMPLVVGLPDGRTLWARADEAGQAVLPVEVGASWPGAVSVRVDVERFMGPLAVQWNGTPTSVEARSIDPRRWALVFDEGTDADDGFADGLRSALSSSLGPQVPLTPDAVRSLRAAGPAERARVLVSLADKMAGRVDVVVLVAAQSRFAGRAGGNRVWFEASAQASVHEVWGAGELGREDVEVTASGVGDGRANAAAREKLAKELSDRVLEVLKPGSR